MSVKPVDAVFFWRATGVSVFKAVYGRIRGKKYTKDFHQPRNELARALEKALGVGRGERVDFEWRWVGGSDTQGALLPAADVDQPAGRMNLRWTTNSSPAPWRLAEYTSAETAETLQGVPGLTNEASADLQLRALEESGERPWLIAVHRAGDGPVLHARAVLEQPLSGREYASWDQLPEAVRDAMHRLTNRAPGGFVEFEQGTGNIGALAKRILRAFEDVPNVLLVGPPGTGKTHAMDELAQIYSSTSTNYDLYFDDEKNRDPFIEIESSVKSNRRVETVLFHPSYAYENFVMGLVPDVVKASGAVTVRPTPGPLLELANFAGDQDSEALLLVDEFNRGNAAAIFGDMLGLLDKGRRDSASVPTPYGMLRPRYSTGAEMGDDVRLPSSLKILAAMNSADRSVAPLDAALRRRFAIIYVAPDLDLLGDHLGASRQNGFDARVPETWKTPEHVAALSVEILSSINGRVRSILGRDFEVGQSVFWNVGGGSLEEALSSLLRATVTQLIGTLALTFSDQDDELAAVLNVGAEANGNAIVARWHNPPTAGSIFQRRLELTDLEALPLEDAKQALASLVGVDGAVRSDWSYLSGESSEEVSIGDPEDSFEEA